MLDREAVRMARLCAWVGACLGFGVGFALGLAWPLFGA